MAANRSYEGDVLIGPLYFLALLLVITPTIDFVTGVQPLAFDNLQWRFGAVGLLAGFLLTPLFGIILAIGVAHYADHWVMQRVIAVVNLVIAGVFLALLVLFVLDTLQLKNLVQEENAAQFTAAAWKALLKHSLFVIVVAWFGIAGFRIRKPARAQTSGFGSLVAGTR
jgi:chromate transport protein ChrA